MESKRERDLPPEVMHFKTMVSPSKQGPTKSLTSRPVSSKIVGLLGGTAKEKGKTFSSHIKYVKEHKRHDPDSNLLCKQEKKERSFFFSYNYKYIKVFMLMEFQDFHRLNPRPE